MRTVLLVSLTFPPSQVAGVHRVRHLAKYLPRFGWYPIVVTVDERYHKESADPRLGRLVSERTEVHRIGASPPWATSWLGVGDLALRAMVPLARKLNALMKERRPDVIFITGWPFYQMLLGERLRARGARVVLDFQDPWVSAEGATKSRWSKGGMAHRLAVLLEPGAVRHADLVTSVSDIQNQQMAARYPWLDPRRMAAIPIGGDPEDFDALRAEPPDNPHIQLDRRHVNLSYVGTFLPRAGSLVRTLFSAVRALKHSDPDLAARMRLNFVGTSNQPDDTSSYRVKPLAEEAGIAELVREVPQRIPYLQALGVLAASDGLLLIGSDEPHYTASKIYPALMAGRPFMSLFHRASGAHAILSAAGGGRALSFDDVHGLEAQASSITDALRTLACCPEKLGRVDPAAYASYTAEAVSKRFAEFFDGLIVEQPVKVHA